MYRVACLKRRRKRKVVCRYPNGWVSQAFGISLWRRGGIIEMVVGEMRDNGRRKLLKGKQERNRVTYTFWR